MTLACIRASLILVSSRTTSTESLATEERKGHSQPSSSDCCSCPLMIKAFSKSLAAASTCPSPGVCEQGDGKRAVRYRGHRRSGGTVAQAALACDRQTARRIKGNTWPSDTCTESSSMAPGVHRVKRLERLATHVIKTKTHRTSHQCAPLKSPADALQTAELKQMRDDALKNLRSEMS